MQVHIACEVPSSPFVCDGSQNLEPLEPEPPSALFRAATLFVSPAASLTGQSPTHSPDLRRLTQRIFFYPTHFRATPYDDALGNCFSRFERDVCSRLGWR